MSLRVAVTLGDPRGIGPEVVRKALTNPPAGADFVVIGPEVLLDSLPEKRVATRAISGGDTGPLELRPGGVVDCSPETAGRVAGQALERAVQLALDGDVSAIVTGPAEKKALDAAGYRFPGHTELLGQLAGGVETAMMLVTGNLRVVLVTTHMALAEVPGALTEHRFVQVGEIARKALREWWGLPEPRLALCALNPHGGEGGMFGTEDQEILAPAAASLGAAGPLPADTVFVRALSGEFDAVLAPYHDVGMTAVKVAGFGTGVNVTLGLPFFRTAPDHGTAFDIAGRGTADPRSMCHAIDLAVELGKSKTDREGTGPD